MPSTIKILPDKLINKIAAGEVVERPASVVKELIENSLDAGATEIYVDIEQAGKRLIRVTDNGSGMTREDARLAFERHATSKLASEAELESIRTMGFRGEALSSIASVSQVRMTTARRAEQSGVMLELEGGAVKTMAAAAAPPGTSIEVNHLFYNTPARLKFMKSPATEASHIISAVSHQAMAHPEIRFKLTHDRKVVLDCPSAANVSERLFQVFGADLGGNLMEFGGERPPARVYGLIGKPNYSRADKAYQEFYVNGRYIRNASLAHALYSAYSGLLMRDRHPAGFVFIELDPSLVDVNVHPAKSEVRFRNQAQIHDLVRDVIREALGGRKLPADAEKADGPYATSGYADRVREAIADFGFRSAEFPLTPSTSLRTGLAFSPEGRGSIAQPLPLGERTPLSHHLPLGERTEVRGDSSPRLPVSASPRQLQPLAQIHDSFIVAQSNDGMALIDQHAAHERVLFEKLQDQQTAGTVQVQDLLLPVQVELGPAEAELMTEHLAGLGSLGFIIEHFGGGTYMIKAVPALMTGGDYQRLLLDVLDEIKVHGKSGKMETLRDEILSVMACHPAIKVHRKLSAQEMERLILDLFSCRMPHSCPHGRPTVVRFSMDEIKRMFKRT